MFFNPPWSDPPPSPYNKAKMVSLPLKPPFLPGRRPLPFFFRGRPRIFPAAGEIFSSQPMIGCQALFFYTRKKTDTHLPFFRGWKHLATVRESFSSSFPTAGKGNKNQVPQPAQCNPRGAARFSLPRESRWPSASSRKPPLSLSFFLPWGEKKMSFPRGGGGGGRPGFSLPPRSLTPRQTDLHNPLLFFFSPSGQEELRRSHRPAESAGNHPRGRALLFTTSTRGPTPPCKDLAPPPSSHSLPPFPFAYSRKTRGSLGKIESSFSLGSPHEKAKNSHLLPFTRILLTQESGILKVRC